MVSAISAGDAMKPTGRRAWRKSCAFMRKNEGSAHSAGIARRNRKRPGFCDDQRPSIAKPFAPRSLVGMTMGARKRAAWAEYQGAILAQDGEEIGSWDDARAKYRIGQRLRPCPGCYRCCPVPCQGCGMLPSLDTDCEACRADHYMMAMYACDGSGVLPALSFARFADTAYWDEMWAQVNG